MTLDPAREPSIMIEAAGPSGSSPPILSWLPSGRTVVVWPGGMLVAFCAGRLDRNLEENGTLADSDFLPALEEYFNGGLLTGDASDKSGPPPKTTTSTMLKPKVERFFILFSRSWSNDTSRFRDPR